MSTTPAGSQRPIKEPWRTENTVPLASSTDGVAMYLYADTAKAISRNELEGWVVMVMPAPDDHFKLLKRYDCEARTTRVLAAVRYTYGTASAVGDIRLSHVVPGTIEAGELDAMCGPVRSFIEKQRP